MGVESKKLKAAAVWLIRGQADAANEAKDAKALGLLISEPEPIAIRPDEEAAVTVFSAMGTQWNIGAMGGIIGLRYEALPAVLAALNMTPSAELLADLRTMESAACEAFNGSK